jgi:hypothetical protein
MEFNQEKSDFLASQIEAIKIHLHLVDEEYLRQLSREFVKRATIQDATSILNPSYDFNRSKLLNAQANAMTHLHQLIVSLKDCDHLKRQIERQRMASEGIEQMFI